MSEAAESIVLCEGYDDRSFWQGLLLSQGCQEDRAARSGYKFQAAYQYRTPAGGLLHVVPCSDQTTLLKAQKFTGEPVRGMAQHLLKGIGTKPLSHLVINVDVDD